MALFAETQFTHLYSKSKKPFALRGWGYAAHVIDENFSICLKSLSFAPIFGLHLHNLGGNIVTDWIEVVLAVTHHRHKCVYVLCVTAFVSKLHFMYKQIIVSMPQCCQNVNCLSFSENSVAQLATKASSTVAWYAETVAVVLAASAVSPPSRWPVNPAREKTESVQNRKSGPTSTTAKPRSSTTV